MGHADEEVGDLYSMLKDKVGFRKKEDWRWNPAKITPPISPIGWKS
jgi:hypothetical protein